jgi:GAF domain-containing protein
MAATRAAELLFAVVAESADGTDLPSRLVAACADALPVSGAGLALMTDKGPAGTVAASDGAALELEELQFSLGEGPCVDASRTGRPVLQPDLAATAPLRWPAFASGALSAGIRAVFALPLRVGAIRLGVLDLYRDGPGPLGAGELREALDFSDAATLLLLHLQSGDPAAGPAWGPMSPMDDRAEVHQATGVVSVQADVGLAEALLLLRARAFAEHRPIGELARDVVEGIVDFRRGHEGIEDGRT